jgi:hypothetical protein
MTSKEILKKNNLTEYNLNKEIHISFGDRIYCLTFEPFGLPYIDIKDFTQQLEDIKPVHVSSKQLYDSIRKELLGDPITSFGGWRLISIRSHFIF